MNPRRVWGTHCRTWDAFDITLPAGVTALVGPNGAGKSTLLNAIDVALFGKGPELARMLTRDSGETLVQVGVEFDHDGDVYRVRRTAGKKTTLDLERLGPDWHVEPDEFGDPMQVQSHAEWEPLTCETMAVTQDRLEGILGLTRTTFRASSFLAQGDGDAFTSAPPRERKEILAQVLRLHLYEQLQALAKTDRSTVDQELSRHVARCEQLEGELGMRESHVLQQAEAAMELDRAKVDIADRTAGLTVLQEQLADARVLAERRAAATAETGRLEEEQRVDQAARDGASLSLADAIEEPGKRERAEELVTKQPAILAGLEQLRTRATAVDAANAERERLTAEYGRLETEISGALRTVDTEVAEVARLQSERDAPRTTGTETDVCPTCRRAIGADLDAWRAVAETLADQQSAAERRRDTAHAAATALQQRAAVLTDQLASEKESSGPVWEEIAKLTDDLARAQAAERWLAAADEKTKTRQLLEENIERLDEAIAARVVRLAAAQAQLSEFEGPDIGDLQMRERRATVELDTVRDRSAEWERRHAVQTAAIARLDELQVELDQLSVRRRELADESTLLRELEKAYSRDGIPALILENAAIPYLEAEASRIVGELGRGYRFELRTQRAKQDGGISEALDVVVHTDSGEALYEDFSGGERTRLDLGLRIALARLLANRRGADVRLLAIDEPSYLDEDGFARLAALLGGLTEFDKVVIVSHVSALRDAFDSYIEVAGGAETGEPSRIVGEPIPVPALDDRKAA